MESSYIPPHAKVPSTHYAQSPSSTNSSTPERRAGRSHNLPPRNHSPFSPGRKYPPATHDRSRSNLESGGFGRGRPQPRLTNKSVSNPRGYTSRRMGGRPGSMSRSPGTSNRPRPHDTQALSSTDYKAWREVTIIIKNLPREYVDTWEVYKIFSRYGQIARIKFPDEFMREDNAVTIVFCTSPTHHFWHPESSLTLPLKNGHRSASLTFGIRPPQPYSIASPVDSRMRLPKLLTIQSCYLFFGLMKAPNAMLGMHMVDGVKNPLHPILLELDLAERKQRIEIRFSTHADDEHEKMCRYRLQAGLQLIRNVMIHRAEDRIFLVIGLWDPPKFYKAIENVEETHESRKKEWKEWPKVWERQTDIDEDMSSRSGEAISLVRAEPVVDTGRWLTYRLDFAISPDIVGRIDTLRTALDHHNIQVKEVEDLDLLDLEHAEAWQYLNPHKASHPSDLHQMQHDLAHLDFDVRYQLEACISQNRLNEYNMKLDFFHQLAAIDKKTSLNLLENVADSKHMYHDPMVIFTLPELRASRNRRVPHGCVLMHSVTVTPTTLRISTPTVEVSNRVIRDYSHAKDRFLRVKFEDEDYIGRIFPMSFYDNQEQVYRRIERALKQGINIAGRQYDFLAHGNSQFREHGGYFFSPTPDLNADHIRSSLGHFDKINIVAKYAARIGQCFSTTRTPRQLPRNLGQQKIPDIYGELDGKKYCFTDGVGKVSPFVATMIADEFRINHSPGNYPSVYQFRMGGYKGVLAVDPILKGVTVSVRESQNKFDSNTLGIEIIRVSSFATAYMNQQIILVLNSLGVPDKVFVDKMETELKRIDLAMTDHQTALDLLTKNVDFNQVTIAMAEMILDGFMDTKEPFLMSLLQLWRAWRMKFLKEKAHMPVENGAFVLGCTDETQTLSMEGPDGLAEIFIQVEDRETKTYKPREGLCLLARNPSLHPGDVRVVRAILVERLLHIKDAVVFPQKGKRDLANMCSGGDLDGDDYLVMWDETLFPPKSGWNFPPMDFTPPIPRMSVDVVTKDQLVENFIRYMKYDRLGTVATRHRAWADFHHGEGGVKHEKCLRLAQLHSIAVDFPKSGVPAQIDDDLLMLPRWPHWMEMNHRPKDKTYHSKAVLGQLYDKVIRQEFKPQQSNPFDARVLGAYDVSPEMLQSARELKVEYDADIRRIMAQQGVKTEFEIWTAFVMSHNREKRDYVFAEEMGRLISMLKMHHYEAVLEKAGVNDKKSRHFSDEEFVKLAPFIVAMYTVTKEQVEAARTEASSSEDGNKPDKQEPLISFPWIFSAELGRIATKGTLRPQELGTSVKKVSKVSKQRQFASFAPEFSDMILEPLPECQMPGMSRSLQTAESPTSNLPAMSEPLEKSSGYKSSIPWPLQSVGGVQSNEQQSTPSAPSTIVEIPAAVDEVGGRTGPFPVGQEWEELRRLLLSEASPKKEQDGSGVETGNVVNESEVTTGSSRQLSITSSTCSVSEPAEVDKGAQSGAGEGAEGQVEVEAAAMGSDDGAGRIETAYDRLVALLGG